MKSLQLKEGHFSIVRSRDGAGDSGPKLRSINPNTLKSRGKNGQIFVGCCIECGSIIARSYQNQDFWLTTPVLEILDVNPEKTQATIKTKNSTYLVRSF